MRPGAEFLEQLRELSALSIVEGTHSAGEAFDSAARRAVEATPFRPAERSGLAGASTVTVDVSFELD